MAIYDRILDRLAARTAQKIEETKPVLVKTDDNILKLADEMMTWPMPYGFNTPAAKVDKVDSPVAYHQLRGLSVNYPIARACINYLKNKLAALDWDIMPTDSEDKKNYGADIDFARTFFKNPAGRNSKFRPFLKRILEDVLVLDQVALYRERTFKNNLLNLVPIDPTTIRIKLDESGRTPEPPEIAYEQIIRGKVTAKLTIDELIFECSNPRSSSPYGLAPLESLVIQATSALKGAMYNLAFFTEGNMPEGFIQLPPDVAKNKDQVKEWQAYFDALVNDPRFQRKLKAIPGGSQYEPVKKPDDMSFERFELWLLQVTCSVFGVPPQDIGFTATINKSTGEVQQALGQERGMRPLANFVKEILDDVIHEDLMMPHLSFSFINLDPTDIQEEVEIADRLIRVGAKSIDEYRQEQGLEPIGMGHAVFTASGPVLVEEILKAGQKEEDNIDEITAPGQQPPFEEEKEEIKRFQKKVLKKLRDGKDISKVKFDSDILSGSTIECIKEGLKLFSKEEDIKEVFDGFIDKHSRIHKGLLELYEEIDDVISD